MVISSAFSAEDIEYTLGKLEELKSRFSLSWIAMAKAAGMERSAYHRLFIPPKNMPSLNVLANCSAHFKIAITELLPPRLGQTDPVKWQEIGNGGQCLLAQVVGDTPLTKQVLKAAQRVGPTGKRRMILAAQTEQQAPIDTILTLISRLPDEQRQALKIVLSQPEKRNLLLALARVTPEMINRTVVTSK